MIMGVCNHSNPSQITLCKKHEHVIHNHKSVIIMMFKLLESTYYRS